MSRSRVQGAAVTVAALLLLAGSTVPAPGADASREIVAVGVARPLEIIRSEHSLLVLGPGQGGDMAGELHRIDLRDRWPIDVARLPRVRIPFPDARLATLGSFALDSTTGALYLGEENGTRIYRYERDGRLSVYALGFHRLMGGSTLAFDAEGGLLVVDHVDPKLSPGEEPGVPGLEQLRDEDYRGPLVLRFTLDSTLPTPRRAPLVPPLYPRRWGGRLGGALLPRFVAITPTADDSIVLLSSVGHLFHLSLDGILRPLAKLPTAQYHRVHMLAAPDGTIFISGGFWIGQLYAVTADGQVTVLATALADPQGIALAPDHSLYIAESALHRIIRLPLPPPRP
jgi:hypothetical protein